MTLTEYAKLPGVADLPMTVKAKFIAALKAEDDGDHAKAAAKLDEAVAEEEKRKNS